MKCPDCGEPMLALLTSVVCPRGCDKIKRGPYCPSCGSGNTEPFDVSGMLDGLADETHHDSVTFHCWPCGEVWNMERQRPETD